MQSFLKWLAAHQHQFKVWVNKTRVGPEWEIRDRVLPHEFLVYYALQNSALFKIGECSEVMNPGHCLWLNPGVLHTFKNLDRQKPFYLYHMRFGLESLKPRTPFPESFRMVAGASDLSVLFDFLCGYESLNTPEALDICRTFLLPLSAIFISNVQQQGKSRQPTLSAKQRQIIQEYVDRRIETRPDVRELALLNDYSHNYFTRLFKRSYGMPLKSWILLERLKRAAEMLQHTSLRVSEIAEKLQFNDVFILSKQFKHYFRESPLTYRQRVWEGRDQSALSSR